MMASSFHLHLQSLQSTFLQQSHFLGQKHFTNPSHKPPLKNAPAAKFNIYEILGGRGICKGEEGLQQELKRTITEESSSLQASSTKEENKITLEVPEDAFEKELLGLTGGFPGGEMGLMKFIEKNPPPKKDETETEVNVGFDQSLVKKPDLADAFARVDRQREESK